MKISVTIPFILTSPCNSLGHFQKACIAGTTLEVATAPLHPISAWPKQAVQNSRRALNPNPISCRPSTTCQAPWARACHTWCSSFSLYWRKTAERQQPGSFVVRYNTKSLLLLAYNGASTQRVSSSSLLQNVFGNALINSWQRNLLTNPCSWTIICSNFTKARGCYDKTLLALPTAEFNKVMTSRIKNRLQRKVCCTPIILRKFNIHEGDCLKQSTSYRLTSFPGCKKTFQTMQTFQHWPLYYDLWWGKGDEPSLPW